MMGTDCQSRIAPSILTSRRSLLYCEFRGVKRERQTPLPRLAQRAASRAILTVYRRLTSCDLPLPVITFRQKNMFISWTIFYIAF